MAKIPAVYVSITDRSFSTPAVASGRSGLIVVISDRGPHNRVVEVNSQDEFITLFGKPDLAKYGQGHYLAAKFLERSNRLFVIKPSLLDSEIAEYNAAIANQFIKYNDPNGSEQLLLNNKFIFTNQQRANTDFGSDFISKYVFCNKDGFNLVDINDYIYSEKDSKSVKAKVVAKGSLEDKVTGTNKGIFYLVLENFYQGRSTVDVNNSNQLLVTPGTDVSVLKDYIVDINNIFTTKIYEFYPGSSVVTNSTSVNTTYNFTKNSEVVEAVTADAFDVVNVEDWIYPATSDAVVARQIVKKDLTDDGKYLIYLDMKFQGITTANTSIKRYIPFEISSIQNMKSESDIDVQDSDNLWYFYAKGTGSYYNRIFIRGVRNVYYEKMYTDSNGEPLYKYAFLDLTVYRSNTDGTSTILEGPWTVSLINMVGDQTVKDISSGKELYLVKVINERSKIISCKDSEYAVTMLEGANYDAEYRRLQIQSLFSTGNVTRLQTKGLEGFFLENGEDGGVFDSYGRIYLDNEELIAAISNCYSGNFKSVDGSIESMVQAIYPWYLFDYVLCGGYPLTVQESAVYLADQRHDCLVLSDTGGLFTDADSDLTIRANDMNWNSWNVAIYTQYRQIFDKFSGKNIWVSPTYHAIECHLRTDNDSWISDPVAGYVKGSVNENLKLAYKMNFTDLEKMMDIELNPTIVEPDGRYFLTQFTAYKPLSQMKRINTVKFVHFLYKEIPKLLKDILQQKANQYWIGQANTRISSFMNNFTRASTRFESISSFSSSVEFDEDSSQLYVSLTIKPLRTIEAIHVNIIVT